MKIMLLRLAVFVGAFALGVVPSQRAVYSLWTDDVSPNTLPSFPVLVKSPQGRFAVARLGDLSRQSSIVTAISDQDLDRINHDLQTSISLQNSKYAYFVVIARGQGYTDVSLEVPTTGDYWRKGWYRVQSNSIHPQRILFLGPLVGVAELVLPTLAGLIALWCCNKVIKKRRGNPVLLPIPSTLPHSYEPPSI